MSMVGTTTRAGVEDNGGGDRRAAVDPGPGGGVGGDLVQELLVILTGDTRFADDAASARDFAELMAVVGLSECPRRQEGAKSLGGEEVVWQKDKP